MQTPVVCRVGEKISPRMFAKFVKMGMHEEVPASAYELYGQLCESGADLQLPVMASSKEPVREFQKRHGAKIYVGEFSAITWAQGADAYLRDCIAVFEEFGWDWSYHAFREWSGWSVEHACEGPGKPFVPSADNPRKRALLDGFRANDPGPDGTR